MDIQKEREAFESWLYECHGTKTYLEESFEAWQAAKAQAIPDGFVVVPDEPSDGALLLMCDEVADCTDTSEMRNAYKAMIEAQEQK